MSEHHHPKAKDWALLATLTLLFGTSYALIAVAVETIPPLTIVLVRLIIAGILAMTIAKIMGRKIPPIVTLAGQFSRSWMFFVVLAVVGNIVPFFLISWGQQEVPSSVTGILVAIMPLATLAIAHFFVKSDRMTLPRLLGFSVGLAGVVAHFGYSALTEIGSVSPIHQLAIIGGALCYSVNSVITRFAPHNDAIMTSALVAIVAAVIVLPFTLIIDQPWTLFASDIAPSVPSMLAVVGLGIFPTALAGIVYFALIKSAGPTFMSLVNYAIPWMAVLIGMVALNERPPATAFMALVLIMLGVAISQYQVLKSSLSGRARPAPKE